MSSPLPPRRQRLPPLPAREPDEQAPASPEPAPAAAPARPAAADTAPDATQDESREQSSRLGGVRPALRVGDRRGLTAAGAVALGLGLGAAGGLVDVLTGPGLRTVFAVCFVVGSVLAAAIVHREDLRAAVVMPPLVYVTLAFLGGVVEQAGEPGSFLTQQGIELANALFVGAPVLVVATLLALLVAAFRAVRHRRRARAAT